MSFPTRLLKTLVNFTIKTAAVQSNSNKFLENIRAPCCNCIVQNRYYKPYTRLPKVYQKQLKKDRNKTNRDDVYFLTDQVPAKHSLDVAMNALRAYDLFGPEEIDILLKVNMGQGKVSL